MAEKKIPKISDDFLHLCRAISLGEDPEFCKRRWPGVCTAIEGTTLKHVEAMIRVLFRSKQPADKQALEEILQHFKAADESFLMSGNDSELEAMCAGIILGLFRDTEDIGIFTALAVTTTAMFGGRKPVVSLDIVGRAEQTLFQSAQSQRQRPDLKKIESAAAPKVDFAEAVKKLAQFNAGGVTAALNDAAAVIEGSLKALHLRVSKAVTEVDRFASLQDEELQMLWWLIGERSWNMDQPFSKVCLNAQPLIFAKELADFTKISPGPESIKGLLFRAGLQGDRELTVAEAINACDEQWLSTLVEGKSPSPVTLPMHFGIVRKLETGDRETWVQGWAAGANLEKNRKLSALALGELFYRERLQISLLEV